jgi:hypothetical protein
MQTQSLQYAILHTKNTLTVMKKLILSAAALTMLIASCQKKDNVTTTASTTPPASKSLVPGGFHQDYNNEKMRRYYDHGPKDYGCDDKEENCAPDDVIIKVPGIHDFVHVIDGNNGIAEYVKANHDLLGQTIPTKYLDAAINGSLSLSMRGDISASYRCILFKDNTNAVTLAVPVIQ